MGNDQIETAATDTSERAKAAGGELLGETKARISGIADHITDAAQHAYGGAKEGVRQAADEVPRLIEDTWDQGRRSYRRASDALRQPLGDLPLTELLLAGAAGYVLAWLIHGRR
jgi:uncharacterized protein YjbJ (UPF0337 family)